MNIAFFSRDFLLTTGTYLIGLPIFICLLFFVNRKKASRVKSILLLLVLMIVFSLIPFNEMINAVFKFDTVEEAVKFDFKNRYQIAYKKKYKNTYFLIGKPKNPYHVWLFASYRKTKDSLQSLMQPAFFLSKYKREPPYKIHYFNNKEDNVTGIFIDSNESISHGGLNENSKISDNYNTKFTYVTTEKGFPLQRELILKQTSSETKKITKGYIYFGIVEQNIKDDYYLEIDGKKIRVMD